MCTDNRMETYQAKFSIAERIRGRYRRSCARYLGREKAALRLEKPLISFTFDDFPRSALFNGGSILKSYGVAGTYYASFGLMGGEAPTGAIFVREDLDLLLRDGHELGCHTFTHCHPWTTPPEAWESSIMKNREALAELLPQVRMRSMSYPLSLPTVPNKRIAGRYFACSRGRGEHCNAGTVDRNFLSSHFLERKLGGPQEALKAIEECSRRCGWLIFSTHDICDNPTLYGWTPEFFETVVRAAVQSGAEVLPVIQAWDKVGASL